jgi:hypothetical protein
LTSDRRQRANRANAKASTGPKTAAGKARAAQNAFRHGLNVPVLSDPLFAPEVEAMARKICGPDTDAATLEWARRIAEAQIDLNRVRASRRRLLTRLLVVAPGVGKGHVMSREREAGEIVSSEAVVSGCEASPILQLGSPSRPYPRAEQSQTVDYAVIRRPWLPAGASLPTAATGPRWFWALAVLARCLSMPRTCFPRGPLRLEEKLAIISRRKAAIRNFDAARTLAITQRPYEA